MPLYCMKLAAIYPLIPSFLQNSELWRKLTGELFIINQKLRSMNETGVFIIEVKNLVYWFTSFSIFFTLLKD